MRTDTELQRGVMEALAWEPSIDAAGIGVSVESGIVMLSGMVKSLPQKWTAVRVAQHVSGVKAVTDELVVKLPGDFERSDADIARAAVNAIDWNVSVAQSGEGRRRAGPNHARRRGAVSLREGRGGARGAQFDRRHRSHQRDQREAAEGVGG